MAKKTNKTSHVLDLLTNGTSSEAGGNPSRVNIPRKVTVVDENSRSNRLSEELLNSLSEELGQEVPRDEEAPAPAPQAAAAPEAEKTPEQPTATEKPAPTENIEPAVQPQETSQTNSVEDLRSKFGDRDETDFHFLNVMEELLLQQDLEGILKTQNVCTCRRCQADVCALALTSLPSKYVVISKTSLSPVLNYYENKFKIAMLTELNKACAMVRETPHHAR